ncbi:MAG: amidohydrolase family protein, partial [Akkermansiaceae bacterium]|nr:amidohydrolase family protein [Verrucomicrobiales bacterium]
MKIIDCDVHPAWADLHEITQRLPVYFREAGGFGPIVNDWRNPFGFQRMDARGPDEAEAGSSLELMRSQLLDKSGITQAILNASAQLQVGVHPHTDYAIAYARAFNDALAETWLTWDERLYGAIIVTPQDPLAAAAEIRRMAANPRFVQVLFTSATRIPLGNRFYWPIYEAACEVGLPVAVH